jgi:hypothetical protein
MGNTQYKKKEVKPMKLNNPVKTDYMYEIKRTSKRVPQNGTVFMPQPPIGQMPSKMVMRTKDTRPINLQDAIIAKNIKPPQQTQKIPNTISAASPLTGTIRE